MRDFLLERPDMVALYKFIVNLPPEKREYQIEIERPLFVEAFELAVGFIPVVGSAISLYEAWSGEDLFGYHLTDLERGILAASVLLPVAGQLVKGGQALYTEARLVKMYGRDAASWQRTIRQSAKVAEQRGSMRAIKAADDSLRAAGKVEGKIAQEAAEALPKLLHSAGHVVMDAENEIKVVWEALSKKLPALAELDELALRRIVERGSNADHNKGQLLEELMESYILPTLRKRQGAFALGVQVPAGASLEFIPGRAIRTASGKAGRQIADGMIGYWEKGVFNVLGIFEAKAGRKGARELSFKTADILKLNKAERKELTAFAKEIWAEEKEIADEARKSFTKSVEAVEKEVCNFPATKFSTLC